MGTRPGGFRPAGRPTGARRDNSPRAPIAAPQVALPPISRTITLAEGMTVKDLSDKLDVRVKDVLKVLLERRMMMNINSAVDIETAREVARTFGAEVETRSFEEELQDVAAEGVDAKDQVTRAPVVTVMGHVDHGKTTLLDSIRTTRVAEREAGGITQHIGAYLVGGVGEQKDKSIVFLDTPGHEAFTLMRARGAKVTDVVILVVAADDGVMPQTREAIDHAVAAGVPIIVAVNKIDKPGANPETVKRQLSDLGLMPEAWGGTTVFVEVSAKQKTNLELLLEMILLVTEIGELKANPKRSALGTVLETKLDRGRGPVATVLVQDGTLNVGDNIIAGPVVGRVRALIDDRGRPAKLAGPSTPVEVLGLETLPSPGDSFQSVADPAKARQIAMFRQARAKEKALVAKGSRLTLETLQQQMAEGAVKDLPIIVKADVQGSAEVLASSLAKLSDDKVKVKVIHSAVGAINESDVLLATASNAIIIGFNVRPDRNAADVAEREKVDIRHHSVIYTVTEEIQKAMVGMLEPTFKEVRLGAAQVRDTFKVPKAGTIAGCMVIDGRITRQGDAQVRLLRDNVVVWEGKLASLRRFKDDVSEVKAGMECGIAPPELQRREGRRHHRGLPDGAGRRVGLATTRAHADGRRPPCHRRPPALRAVAEGQADDPARGQGPHEEVQRQRRRGRSSRPVATRHSGRGHRGDRRRARRERAPGGGVGDRAPRARPDHPDRARTPAPEPCRPGPWSRSLVPSRIVLCLSPIAPSASPSSCGRRSARSSPPRCRIRASAW